MECVSHVVAAQQNTTNKIMLDTYVDFGYVLNGNGLFFRKARRRRRITTRSPHFVVVVVGSRSFGHRFEVKSREEGGGGFLVQDRGIVFCGFIEGGD